MKKIFRSVAALAVVLFAGCTTEAIEDTYAPIVDGKTTVITLDLSDVRTTLGDLDENGKRKVLWSAGDKININGVTSAEAVINEENPSLASFEFVGELATPYNVLYPAEFYKDEATITLPSVQNKGVGTFATNTLPLASVAGAGEGVVLHHVAGALRFRIKQAAAEGADAHVVHHLEFRGNNGEQLSGDFAIDYSTLTLTPTSEAEADKVVATNVNANSSKEQDLDVFVVVPARTYEKGFTLRIIDDNGHYMDVKSEISQTIAKGEIKAMPSVEFVPTGTLVNVEIKSAADLVAFAKEYNTGAYAGIDPFVVELANDIVFDDATSAEWEPIGNVLSNEDTNYFHGIFDGKGYAIKNWKTSLPLFDYTGGGSIVQNLTIDASCTIVFADDSDGALGSIIGYHKGLMTNCHNNANVTLSGAWAANSRVGGLVGRLNEGHVEGCTMNANITADNTFLSAGSVYLGGLVGANTNANGVIKDVQMKGNVTFNGGVSAKGYYFIGGIAGMTRGEVTGCSNLTTSNVTISTLTNEYTDAYVGGIAGQADTGVFNNNTNNAAVNYNVNIATYNQIAVGGVVGYAKIATDKLENNGRVFVTPGAAALICKNTYIGGVAGLVENSVTTATNNGQVLFQSLTSDATLHYWTCLGGIAGHVLKNKDVTLDGCINNGFVGYDCSVKGNGRASTLGGIVGLANAGLHTIKNCTNNGYIFNNNFNNNHKANINSGGSAFAGCIVGFASGKDANNRMVITNCTSNPGSFTEADKNGLHLAPTAGANLYARRGMNAGVAGYAQYTNITECTTNISLLQGQQGYVGGIVGWVKTCTISKNKVEGTISTTDSTTLGTGGILGVDAAASVIEENIVNATITSNKTTPTGVLVGLVTNNNTCTLKNNKVAGTLSGAAITLDSAMVGSGTHTIEGTTLYTE